MRGITFRMFVAILFTLILLVFIFLILTKIINMDFFFLLISIVKSAVMNIISSILIV